ncbi:MAG: hypothetical protein UY48_C0013G0036 [Candidatus Gottesmanbacteria bacterium GW2011_GWB1_49_7]|uniref:MazG nucleotide pyrophosphohydrolase n=1 Tax=Candidatus Gottesmanbacteria bacterium GW2011_GWB1_49_7 TaxID=1618448 RepID=A0A0G1VZJ9_9BACT|nr:MAG: hypothetical protein UY48_C0013G0036 [Candidatus Gottesmanbacteria bacterium GW2011_GWB1_49_7]
MSRPLIMCLCGSTRFTREMLLKQWELTKQGFIVLSWCALPDDYYKTDEKSHIGDQEGVKALVDEVHKRKIDLADTVHVLNFNGYIGESTRSEINYAIAHGKPVTYEEADESEGRVKPETIRKVITEYIDTIGLDARENYREHYNDEDVIAMLKDIEDNLIAEIEKGGDA